MAQLSKTVQEVNKVLSRINTHPEYNVHVGKIKKESIRESAMWHSFELERRAEALQGVQSEKDSKVVYQNLMKAWDYLSKWGIDLSSLSSAANFVEPRVNKGFRKSNVTIGEVPPVEAGDIDFSIKTLTDNLREYDGHPIHKGIEAHIEFARIHPYEDGNGRTARLIQNLIFEQSGYPSAIITAPDGELYTILLRKTLKDRVSNESTIYEPSQDEGEFRRFLESKLLTSVEELENELKGNRSYLITLKGIKEKPVAYSIAKMVRGIGRNGQSSGVKAHLTGSGKDYTLEVLGDLSLENLDNVLSRAKNNYGIRYTSKINSCNKR